MDNVLARLAGKRALITGGAAGIGRDIALRLARETCDIRLIDVDEQKAMATAAEIRSLGRHVDVAAADVADEKSLRAAVAQLAGRGAAMESLINNAAIARLGSLLTISNQDWRDTFGDGVAVLAGKRDYGAIAAIAQP